MQVLWMDLQRLQPFLSLKHATCPKRKEIYLDEGFEWLLQSLTFLIRHLSHACCATGRDVLGSIVRQTNVVFLSFWFNRHECIILHNNCVGL